MRNYKNGNLYTLLEQSISWKDIVNMLLSITDGLNYIHENGVVHGHLHGGNILVDNEIISKIADTGLYDHNQTTIYGVIPFVAPEIFDGNKPTKASDIYSFGIIMWMLSAGLRPYHNRPHNNDLIKEIRLGLKPNLFIGTPHVFSKLILQCLDMNPSNRPNASQIYHCLRNWRSEIWNNSDKIAIEIRSKEFIVNILSCHEQAIYYSRPLIKIANNYNVKN